MGISAEAGVVGEHALLQLDYALHPADFEHIRKARYAFVPQLRVIAEIVDQQRDDHEETDAEADGSQHPADTALLFAFKIPELYKQRPEEDDGQADGAVNVKRLLDFL